MRTPTRHWRGPIRRRRSLPCSHIGAQWPPRTSTWRRQGHSTAVDSSGQTLHTSEQIGANRPSDQGRWPSGDGGRTRIEAVRKGGGSPPVFQSSPIQQFNILAEPKRKMRHHFIYNLEFECLILICLEYGSPLTFCHELRLQSQVRLTREP
jgi:hypothetical protein